LKEKVQALSNASMKIGQAMYGSKKPEDEASNQGQSSQTTEEAEFKEKK
jgi:hypothetical protein